MSVKLTAYRENARPVETCGACVHVYGGPTMFDGMWCTHPRGDFEVREVGRRPDECPLTVRTVSDGE